MKKYVLKERTSDKFGTIKLAVRENETLFSAKDCAKALEYKDTKKAIATHVDDEYKIHLTNKNFRGGEMPPLKNKKFRGNESLPLKNKNFRVGESPTLKLNNFGEIFITQAGFIELTMGSKMKAAKTFKKWVLEEVVPSVLNEGEYKAPKKTTKKKIFKLLKRDEDQSFKKHTQNKITVLSKKLKIMKGQVWKIFIHRYNTMFGTNFTTKRKNFMEEYGIKKLTIREFLDITDEKKKALVCLNSLIIFPEDDINEKTLEELKLTVDCLVDTFSNKQLDIINKQTRKEIKKLKANIKKVYINETPKESKKKVNRKVIPSDEPKINYLVIDFVKEA